jgi:hypothetical protein
MSRSSAGEIYGKFGREAEKVRVRGGVGGVVAGLHGSGERRKVRVQCEGCELTAAGVIMESLTRS